MRTPLAVIMFVIFLVMGAPARAQLVTTALVAANAVDASAAAPVLNSTSHQSRVTGHLLSPIRQTRSTIADLAKCSDKQFCASGYGYLGAYGADMVSTHGFLERQPWNHEGGWLFTGTRSTAKVSLAYGALTVANFTLANWMKHSKHRWIRDAWWAPLAYGGVTHFRAAVRNEGIR